MTATRYAFVNPVSGAATEIAGAFTGPDGQKYPNNWLALSTPEDRAERGIQAITEVVNVPYGQASSSRELRVVDGLAVEIDILTAIPLATLQAAKLTAVDTERDRRLQLDFGYDFGGLAAIDDAGATITAGLRQLQMRFAPDQRNWQALQSQALAAVVMGAPTALMPMRAEDNWNVQTTAADVLAATTAMFLRNAAILFHGAALKSQVRAAADTAGVAAVDLAVGWP